MANMSNVLGLVFANMHDSTISDLTKLRTMGSVPYGARYRLIDFTLSNMVNSGINTVGVITKANYQSLIDHLGSGAEWDLSRKTGGLHLLPPYGHINGGLYRGRLEALAGVIDFIRYNDAEYVLISDTDVICNIDFKKVVESHEETGADITVVYTKMVCDAERSRTKTILSVSDSGKIYDILVRPEISGEHNVSMNMFVMKKDFLQNLVIDMAGKSLYSFEVDVLQHKLNELNIYGYRFDGYTAQIDCIKTYFNANMELMNPNVRKELFNGDDPIYTKVRDEAPAKYGLDSICKNSIVADGCIIEGTVENSVLFRGVKVGKNAVVRNCILMQDTQVGEKCEMNYVITDKDVLIGNYRSIGGTEAYPVFVGKKASV
ncbi:MAG: glucose-1-phosphate adenylyltransferase subunit GlgD [Firmicutes bacterium]|nr:glucose-1-phosphate adenylyltransferase subunit GlgD [[Eubacterium] siraeum]MCM1488112.1 glucose-1-phosphate adenylyltransferase subunit GlgD [Bacillota bacterium]